MLFYYKLQIESHYLQCLFASRLPGEPAPVSAEGGTRGLHQVGPSEGPSALGRRLWKPRSTLQASKLWPWACFGRMHALSPGDPLLQCSPGLPLGALRLRPHPQSRGRVPAPVWPWGSVQSWRAQACVCFCSQECREQESALETAPWFRRASQMVMVVKSPPANAGDMRDTGLIPGSGRSPGEGKGGLPYSSDGKESACSAGDPGSLPGSGRSPGEGKGGLPYSSGGKESSCSAGDAGSIPGSGRSPAEGDGNPLQYSCLGNPMEEEPGGLKSMGSQRAGHDWQLT